MKKKEEKQVRQISAVIKEPGAPAHPTFIDDTLEAYQEAVGGYIETVAIFSNMIVICDEEGILKGKELNCSVLWATFYGTILFVGVKGEEFADVPLPFFEFRKIFPEICGVEVKA